MEEIPITQSIKRLSKTVQTIDNTIYLNNKNVIKKSFFKKKINK